MHSTRRPLRWLAAVAAAGLAGASVAAVPALSAGAAEGDPFISEIHYDNASTDAGEAIEIQADPGTDLSGWQLVLYNGNGGAPYNTRPLSGTVPAAGVVVATYPVDGVQNGSPDGVALVRPDGSVAEFLSYEGGMTAVGGPADGMASIDIGVSEASTTPAGQSLQKVQGAWTGPLANTFGALNGGGDPDPDPEPEPATIAEIQGTGAASPLTGTLVETTGVVTAAYPTGGFAGYYVQTPGTGGDQPRTASDAVFVYSPSTADDVEIGDHVRVTGEVTEYFGLTEIELAADGLETLTEPAEAVKPVPFTLPATEAGREVYEGMLVRPADGFVVSDTYALGGWGSSAFGSIGLGFGGPLVQETEIAAPGSPEYDAAATANAARSVALDDGQSSRTATSSLVPYLTNDDPARTGAGVTFQSDMIFDYRFQWNFQPLQPVTGPAPDVVTFGTGNTRAANGAPQEVGGDLQLSAFNVLNYFTTLGIDLPGCEPYTDRAGNPLTVADGCDARGAWDTENFERQEAKIVAAINGLGADVVALEEIENSAAFGQDRDISLSTLVDALNEVAGAGTWAFVPSPAQLPSDEDVIRTAFIYRTAAVQPVGESVILIDDPAFHNAREPLAQEFRTLNTGYEFTAIVNHFKSKGGECGDLPEGCFDADRTAQAQALVAFADERAAATGTDHTFLLGDFNSYSGENPMQALYDAGYADLNNEHAGEHTYVFDGKVGSLDHVLASPSVVEAGLVTGVDVWNINSVESVLFEYSRYNYFASELFQPGTVYRASDHDPILVGVQTPVTFDGVRALVEGYAAAGTVNRSQAAQLLTHLSNAERLADGGLTGPAGQSLDRFVAVAERVTDEDARATLVAAAEKLREQL
ncbi:ExeM/NucH family extracellular endonuclease [Jiangella aurantiaca]|uniref:ExeM/NucH family extracellular endonuclease n=1 Tax=Jiangella aurantiaca TaxID=2530373 RepID=A0A4R4ZYS2_9ACTN|nr:ExeM/NucH family extracellular endonuclease [Jiangella aurantiaca]TDD64453.1 ExeM/NucH family extracellular endonuclease [Jiangella aurantiaca]